MEKFIAIVEELARAICKADGKDPDADWRRWDMVMLDVAVKDPETWRLYIKHARGVLTLLGKDHPSHHGN